MGKFHAESQSVMLVMPLENYDTLGADTSSGRIRENYTSLLKIVSSFDEVSDSGAELDRLSSVSSALADLDADVTTLYGNTSRATEASFMDSVVNYGSSYATAGRVLTLSILNDVIQNLRLNGGTPKVILTGYDTIQAISD